MQLRLSGAQPQLLATCSESPSPPTLPIMGGPSESSLRASEKIAAWARAFADVPRQRAENRTAARLIDLWDARRARGAESLFAPTIGAAIRAGRPWLSCYCPGCGVVGQIDLRTVDRHRGATVESLIPELSCTRCSPHPPFAKLIGLRGN
jgi:hypothetical protein